MPDKILNIYIFILPQHLIFVSRITVDFVGCHYTTKSRVNGPTGATHCTSKAPTSYTYMAPSKSMTLGSRFWISEPLMDILYPIIEFP